LWTLGDLHPSSHDPRLPPPCPPPPHETVPILFVFSFSESAVPLCGIDSNFFPLLLVRVLLFTRPPPSSLSALHEPDERYTPCRGLRPLTCPDIPDELGSIFARVECTQSAFCSLATAPVQGAFFLSPTFNSSVFTIHESSSAVLRFTLAVPF